MSFWKKNAVEVLEGEVSKLASRRASLEAKLQAAVTAAEAARAARRDFLIDGAENEQESARLEAEAANAERIESSIRDALADLAARLADGERRLAAAREAQLREGVAAETEKAAAAIEIAAAELDRHIEALSAAFEKLAAAIRFGDGLPRTVGGGEPRRMTSFEAARLVLAEGLYHAAPDAFEVHGLAEVGGVIRITMPVPYRRRDYQIDTAIPKGVVELQFRAASGAAEANLLTPMRDVATAIREGRMRIEGLFERPPTPEPKFRTTQTIVFLKKATYLDEAGDEVTIDPGRATIPSPIGEKALALGVASFVDSAEAEELMEFLRLGDNPTDAARKQRLQIDVVDLRISLKALLDEADCGRAAGGSE